MHTHSISAKAPFAVDCDAGRRVAAFAERKDSDEGESHETGSGRPQRFGEKNEEDRIESGKGQSLRVDRTASRR